jgi:hypothetical protein
MDGLLPVKMVWFGFFGMTTAESQIYSLFCPGEMVHWQNELA